MDQGRGYFTPEEYYNFVPKERMDQGDCPMINATWCTKPESEHYPMPCKQFIHWVARFKTFKGQNWRLKQFKNEPTKKAKERPNGIIILVTKTSLTLRCHSMHNLKRAIRSITVFFLYTVSKVPNPNLFQFRR